MERYDPQLARQHAWDYFSLHSGQRMTSLNFYLVISTVLSAGIVSSFEADFTFAPLRLFLGLLLALCSVVFWRIDLRTRQMIKSAESALIAWETRRADEFFLLEPTDLRLFAIDRAADSVRPRTFLPISYYDSFRVLFVLFGAFGLFTAALAFV